MALKDELLKGEGNIPLRSGIKLKEDIELKEGKIPEESPDARKEEGNMEAVEDKAQEEEVREIKREPEKGKPRRALEEERLYREGLSSVMDIIAPSAFQVTPSFIQLGDKYARSVFVHMYPRYLQTSWLSPIVNLDAVFDIAMFIYSVDSRVILKNLRNKVGQIESTMAMAAKRGEVRDPVLETALTDVEQLRDALMQGTEKFFKFGMYFTIYAKSVKELDSTTETLENIISQRLVFTKRAVLQMEQGFNSTLPIASDDLAINNSLNTDPLSSMFPFVSSELTSNDGILYGINRHNNSLILFDRFSLENANSVVFAKSGAGKSYTIKLEILRSMMMGTDVIVIDPENEYRHLCDAVEGSYLDVSLSSKARINPLDLPKKVAEDETAEDIIRSNILNLTGLVDIMLGGLSTRESSLLDTALNEVYEKKGITSSSDLSQVVEYPLMEDLENILRDMGEEGPEMAERLRKYTEGTFAGIFNQPTNIDLDNQFVTFSIRNLEDALRPIAMYVILGYIWSTIRSELKKRIMVIDEAWWMMQSDYSAKFLFSLAKRARKYYLGVTTITQDVTDFLSSEYGKPIVTNSSMQFLFKQSPVAIDLIQDTFHLTDGEKYLLLESDIGEGIFFAGNKHVAIKVVASYAEDQIITTDPRQLLEIQKAKEEFVQQIETKQEKMQERKSEAGKEGGIDPQKIDTQVKPPEGFDEPGF